MLRSVNKGLVTMSKPIIKNPTKLLSYTSVVRRAQSPSNDTAQDILRSFPGSQRGSSKAGLNVSFNDSSKNSSSEINQDHASILPEQIREEAASLKNFNIKTGRTVDVNNSDTNSACRRLGSIVFANQIAIDRRNQRFHMKPGKRAELKRSQRHRRDFMKGFKRLIDVVKDAKRKGY